MPYGVYSEPGKADWFLWWFPAEPQAGRMPPGAWCLNWSTGSWEPAAPDLTDLAGWPQDWSLCPNLPVVDPPLSRCPEDRPRFRCQCGSAAVGSPFHSSWCPAGVP